MNPFQLIPPKARAICYMAYGFAGLAVTSVAAGFGAIDHAVPTPVLWVGGALVPLAPLFGVAAVSNVPTNRAEG